MTLSRLYRFALLLFVMTNISISAYSATPFLHGDMDGDGVLSVNDVNELKKIVSCSNSCSSYNSAADMNYDGDNNITDITILINELSHPVRGLNNGHEYVDLGLSVKWATCNIGAETPEGCGDYFAWGETEPKESYNWSTYKWMTPGKSSWDYVTKYTIADNQSDAIWYSNYTFTGDKKTSLELDDDAAHVNWGNNWRMPTRGELNALRTRCKWTWISLNGMNGYKVTGPNGKSIFMPASGYYEDDALTDLNEYADYWSSSLDSSDSDYAYFLFFNTSYVFWYCYFRYYGQSIRPVCSY